MPPNSDSDESVEKVITFEEHRNNLRDMLAEQIVDQLFVKQFSFTKTTTTLSYDSPEYNNHVIEVKNKLVEFILPNSNFFFQHDSQKYDATKNKICADQIDSLRKQLDSTMPVRMMNLFDPDSFPNNKFTFLAPKVFNKETASDLAR